MSARPFKCRYIECTKTFKNKSDRKKHEKFVHSSSRYQCPIPGCGIMFKSKQGLKTHIHDTHSDSASYKCSYPSCSKSYKHLSSLQRHIRIDHSSLKYQCPYPDCNKIFKRKDSISHHLKYTHNDAKSQRIPCPYPECNQSFKHPKSLRSHIQFMHNDVPRIKCPYPNCDRTYQRKSSLNEHIRFVHLDKRPHVCKICGEQYRQRYLLTYHLEHNLCWGIQSEDRAKFTIDHHKAVIPLEKYFREVKKLKSTYMEVTFPNGRRLDLLVYYPDNRVIGFDATISRSTTFSLRTNITRKFGKDYEQFCDLLYIVAISGIKNAFRTIRERDTSPEKPRRTHVVHWRTIVRDSPKYIRIFQQIENGTYI